MPTWRPADTAPAVVTTSAADAAAGAGAGAGAHPEEPKHTGGASSPFKASM
eukprot:CAMPEP_0197584728 /NCGR_PEP_ID=MMETSP1326-20131121/7252_1 /TAXON_ID=1155430 /ORGANISM="Genus nov. species nov., Strain RCC2288" /LENGTH=50 /DNA_ID=CAMNT_0043149139 /DNA_START=191 /DNA_END=343 /DNA_ORIENTATION=+